MYLAWFYLAVVIILEVIAGVVTKLYLTKNPLLFYGLILPSLSFARLVLFAQVIKAGSGVDLSVAYAIRYGASIALIAVVGILLFKESITVLKVVSIILVVVGLIGLNFPTKQ